MGGKHLRPLPPSGHSRCAGWGPGVRGAVGLACRAPTCHLLREGQCDVTKPKAFAPHVLPNVLGATWRLCLANRPLSPASMVHGTRWAEGGLGEAERASRRGDDEQTGEGEGSVLQAAGAAGQRRGGGGHAGLPEGERCWLKGVRRLAGGTDTPPRAAFPDGRDERGVVCSHR